MIRKVLYDLQLQRKQISDNEELVEVVLTCFENNGMKPPPYQRAPTTSEIWMTFFDGTDNSNCNVHEWEEPTPPQEAA